MVVLSFCKRSRNNVRGKSGSIRAHRAPVAAKIVSTLEYDRKNTHTRILS